MRRLLVGMATAAGLTVPIGLVGLVGGAAPAGACGGLVSPNGTISLVRTTTLAAYADGVERYVTGFEFNGEAEEVGALVPLPDVPSKVEQGGDWTLQRLVQEVTPVDEQTGVRAAAESLDSAGVDILLETEIDALDITVLRGGGDAVGEWATENGFGLTPDAPEVLDFYAARSPVFMAAKFDASRAAELGRTTGDSIPIMATIPTDDPWVPLRILGLGLPGDEQIQADVFLLTESDPELLAGGPGIQEVRSEAASDLLLDDLRSDERMEWVPEDMWLSYLQVDTPAAELDYDLAVSTDPTSDPSLNDAGIDPVDAVDAVAVSEESGGRALWPLAAGAGVGLAVVTWSLRRRGARSTPESLAP